MFIKYLLLFYYIYSFGVLHEEVVLLSLPFLRRLLINYINVVYLKLQTSLLVWECFAIIMTIVSHQPKWSERYKTELSGHWSASLLCCLTTYPLCVSSLRSNHLTSSQLLDVPCLVPKTLPLPKIHPFFSLPSLFLFKIQSPAQLSLCTDKLPSVPATNTFLSHYCKD